MSLSAPRWTRRAFRIGIILGLCAMGSGCNQNSSGSPSIEEDLLDEPLVPLTETFLSRALGALEPRLSPESEIFEIRVTGRSFSVQLRAKKDLPASDKNKAIRAGALIQLDYLERPSERGQPPIGRIFGPQIVPVLGRGKLEENVFPFSDVELEKMGKAFKIACLAVDPEDGQVARLVVRRYLPFSEGIRGRIFVESPRMNGSIDVNERGVPLRR